MDTCRECQKKAAKLFLCARCKEVNYCSKDCQRKAWKLHKTSCTAPEDGSVQSQARAMEMGELHLRMQRLVESCGVAQDIVMGMKSEKFLQYIRDMFPTSDELGKSGVGAMLETLKTRLMMEGCTLCSKPKKSSKCTLCAALMRTIQEIHAFAERKVLHPSMKKLISMVKKGFILERGTVCYAPGVSLDFLHAFMCMGSSFDTMVCVSMCNDNIDASPSNVDDAKDFIGRIASTLRALPFVDTTTIIQNSIPNGEGPIRLEYLVKVTGFEVPGKFEEKRVVYYLNENYLSFFPPEIDAVGLIYMPRVSPPLYVDEWYGAMLRRVQPTTMIVCDTTHAAMDRNHLIMARLDEVAGTVGMDNDIMKSFLLKHTDTVCSLSEMDRIKDTVICGLKSRNSNACLHEFCWQFTTLANCLRDMCELDPKVHAEASQRHKVETVVRAMRVGMANVKEPNGTLGQTCIAIIAKAIREGGIPFIMDVADTIGGVTVEEVASFANKLNVKEEDLSTNADSKEEQTPEPQEGDESLDEA